MVKRNIVTLSGGMASAYVAIWAAENNLSPIFYFNDTRWEHPDLYRFLADIEKALGIKITHDTDGRTPEQVCYDKKFLANNRIPLCSRILKAERLQAFIKHGDSCFFGIDNTEKHRAARIEFVYNKFGINCRFPLVENNISKQEIEKKIKEYGIKKPAMYDMGFKHNNCSGGCVRAGKATWALLLRTMPEVYTDRERLESEFSTWSGQKTTFLKDESLKELRERIQKQPELVFKDIDETLECVGICNSYN
jgi:3'-phosphoadenosine 5'-phosphosulfate sulfotransferase (PAPS reductase)/FAD synthetase